MSAIAGLWRFNGQPNAGADCQRMLAAQEIYGPHDGAVWHDDSLAMGRRLFHTLQEDVHDRQPLRTHDGRLTLVADVRLDNRSELTRALGIPDGEARQSCDAAILLACLDRWGEAALDRLAGDFAFALWDARAQSLTLARDICGHRPLHFHRGRGFFAFASMPKGLHALPEIPRAPDETVMAEFVALIPENSGRGFFAGIERVESAHVTTVTRDRVTSRCHWEPRRPGPQRMSAQDYIDGLRHHLDQATQATLRGAGGTVGSRLSGGLDSSAVTTTAARLLAPEGRKIVAFTAVPRQDYDGADRFRRLVDEGPLAAETAAKHPNIEHVLVRSGHRSPLTELDRIFFLIDRPVLNLSNWVWVQAINNDARARKLKVLLRGRMGNFTLSYDGRELLPELLRRGRVLALLRAGARLVAKDEITWRGVVAGSLGPYVPRGLWRSANRRFSTLKRDALTYTAIRPERLAAFDIATLSRDRGFDFTYRRRNDSFALRKWAIVQRDPGNYNKGTLGGWGIDVRDPTADKRLAEFCLSIPTEEYLVNGTPRALARTALADRLPRAVLNERRKAYQGADWYDGLAAARTEIGDELKRLSECTQAAEILDVKRLQALVDDWPTSGWDTRYVITRYRLSLLRGISAGHFIRKATGANR